MMFFFFSGFCSFGNSFLWGRYTFFCFRTFFFSNFWGVRTAGFFRLEGVTLWPLWPQKLLNFSLVSFGVFFADPHMKNIAQESSSRITKHQLGGNKEQTSLKPSCQSSAFFGKSRSYGSAFWNPRRSSPKIARSLDFSDTFFFWICLFDAWKQ